jgi:hypothetical protein
MEWFEALQRRPAYRQWVMVPRAATLEEWNRIERELG